MSQSQIQESQCLFSESEDSDSSESLLKHPKEKEENDEAGSSTSTSVPNASASASADSTSVDSENELGGEKKKRKASSPIDENGNQDYPILESPTSPMNLTRNQIENYLLASCTPIDVAEMMRSTFPLMNPFAPSTRPDNWMKRAVGVLILFSRVGNAWADEMLGKLHHVSATPDEMKKLLDMVNSMEAMLRLFSS